MSLSGFRPVPLSVAAKVVLNLVMVPGKIKGENAFLSRENQSPGQISSALVNSLAQFSDGNSRVRMRISESVSYEFQRGGHFIFAACFPHNRFEPFRQFNGNHACPR